MTIRNLIWKKTYDNIVNESTTPIYLEDWEAEALGTEKYRVGNTLSGKIFFNIPEFFQKKGFYTLISKRCRKQCKSIEEGKRLCEAHWQDEARKAFVEK